MFKIRFYPNRLSFFIFLFLSFTASAKSRGCDDVKNGVFILFSKDDASSSINRSGSISYLFVRLAFANEVQQET